MFNKKNTKTIIIEGMMCEHCKKKVEDALSDLEEVSKVKIDLKNKKATITLTKDIDNDKIKDTITNLDYKVISIE